MSKTLQPLVGLLLGFLATIVLLDGPTFQSSIERHGFLGIPFVQFWTNMDQAMKPYVSIVAVSGIVTYGLISTAKACSSRIHALNVTSCTVGSLINIVAAVVFSKDGDIYMPDNLKDAGFLAIGVFSIVSTYGFGALIGRLIKNFRKKPQEVD